MKRTTLIAALAVWLVFAPVAHGAWLHFHSGSVADIGTTTCDVAWQHGINDAYDGHAWVAENAMSCTSVQSKVVWLWMGAWVLHVGPVHSAFSGIDRDGILGIDDQTVCGNSQCVTRS